MKRSILTAIDHVTKFVYARMYPSGSSQSAADFLQRLLDPLRRPDPELPDRQLLRRTAVEERFNETLDFEFLREGNLLSDVDAFNARLAPWLMEYNTVNTVGLTKHSPTSPPSSSSNGTEGKDIHYRDLHARGRSASLRAPFH
ncbi:MAG: hypothetical protein ABIT01_09980 [Thermoanaerobaculia bacterium]